MNTAIERGIKMKNLTIIVPAYNSEDYLARCLDTLIVSDQQVEILVINDGSTDSTGAIGDHYQAKYPDQVRVIHKENGGHGSGVNTGIREAKGRFIKVVDSDDWLDKPSYEKLRDFIRELPIDSEIDMIISNYVYEKVGAKHKKVVEYSKFLPRDRSFYWDEVSFPMGKYLLMHSIIYRTDLLKKMNLELPEHTFYVDNLFVFEPLKYVRKMYYVDVNLYRYFIGRDDQSVNESVMIKRIDQQLFVNKRLITLYLKESVKNIDLDNYMLQFIEIVTTVSSVLLLKDGSQDSLEKKEELWEFIFEANEELYEKLRRGLMGKGLHLKGKTGKRAALAVYSLAQRVYGFN